MLPTIWNDFMWHSGISGSMVSMFGYILAVTFIYKLVFMITKRKLNGLIAVLCMGININFLYLQSTPMTEALFVATLTMSVYYLTKWVYFQKLQTLLAASLFFFLSSINRYEGWPVVVAAAVCVALISYYKKGLKKMEGLTILFCTGAFAGIILWLLWQLIIFHNPLYFLTSDYSSKYQTAFQILKGGDPAYKNIVTSIKIFYYSIGDVIGYIALITACLGIISSIIAILYKRKYYVKNLPVFILLTPGIFLIYAMYKGNIPVNVPEIKAQSDYFNVRYALYSLPAISVFVALLPSKKVFSILVFLAILLNAVFLFNVKGLNIATIKDAGGNTANVANINFYLWGKNDYRGGLILASATTSDPILFDTGLHMSNFITEGSGKYWTESLKDPGKYVTWVILSRSDRDQVNKYLNLTLMKNQFYVYKDINGYLFYKKND
jgi:uncharacterized membrane protein YjjB (DUF3815 family)